MHIILKTDSIIELWLIGNCLYRHKYLKRKILLHIKFTGKDIECKIHFYCAIEIEDTHQLAPR